MNDSNNMMDAPAEDLINSTDQETFTPEPQPAIVQGPLMLDSNLASHLPQGRLIYTKLREGTHLSADSPDQFPLYKELEQHRESYTHLFALLGYELVYHPDGFFYFIYPDSVTGQSLTTSRKVALLIYTLVDFLQDNNFDPANTISSESIELRLIDDTRNHYSDLYTQADLATMDAVTNLLEWMARRGFCQFVSDERVRFLKPVARFLEAAEELAEAGEVTIDEVTEDAASEDDATTVDQESMEPEETAQEGEL